MASLLRAPRAWALALAAAVVMQGCFAAPALPVADKGDRYPWAEPRPTVDNWMHQVIRRPELAAGRTRVVFAFLERAIKWKGGRGGLSATCGLGGI